MGTKQPKPGSTAAFKGLELADKQILNLYKLILPQDPHLLSVPTHLPFRDTDSYEHRGTPFANYEVRQLQHMTMISAHKRGVARAEGDWEGRIESGSPASLAARSSTTTPSHSKELKVPQSKMSYADYQLMKKTGIKPSPRPTTEGDGKPGHKRNNSAASHSTAMSRVASFEGAPEIKQNGASALVPSNKLDKASTKESTKSAASSNLPGARTSTPITNGHAERPSNSLHIKDSKPPQAHKSLAHVREPIRHQLPPRPQSPPRKSFEVKQPLSDNKKRPLDSADARHPEKRAKVEHSRTPSGSQNQPPRKPDTPSESRPSPLKNIKHTSTPSRSSPYPKKDASDAKLSHAKGRADKPAPLPQLLEPLPEDLFNLADTKNPDPKIPTPNLKHNNDTDTIVVKASPSSTSSKLPKKSDSRCSSPLLPLPEMLPFDLDPIIEEALARAQAKAADRNAEKSSSQSSTHGDPERMQSSSTSRDTVGARYQEVRRPNVPGVARKTVTPKVGHPPKKAPGESSKARLSNEKEKLVVKLKYKKRRAKDVQRILGIQAKPSKEFQKLERERHARLNPSRNESESEDEMPLSSAIAKSAPSRKRPSDTQERTEPALKRAKLPDNIDVPKAKAAAEPAFKSPGPSAPSQKNLLSTPKKGDAMKSVAMRKVISNDGSARTPQTISTSTPASAEKPRTNGEHRSHPDDDRLRAELSRADALAIKLKRKMDEILQTKGRGFESVPESQRKLGLSVGIECVTMYMTSFALKDRLNKYRSVATWESSRGLWDFVDRYSRGYPVLRALNLQLGAVLKEEVGRVYVESLQKDARDQPFLKALAENSIKCTQHWKEVHRARHILVDLGAPETLGPWTSVAEAAAYITTVLELFAKKEGTGWRTTSA